MSDKFDDYPEPRPLDTALEMVKGLAGSAFPGAGALTRLIQTSHSRRLDAFHRRTAERLRSLENAYASSLFHRAMDGDEYARDAILSTYATVTRLLQEAMDEEKRQALAAGMASSLMWPADAEDVERRYFLRCLSEFEVVHMHLLALAQQGGDAVIPFLNAPGPLGENAQAAWSELNDRGMVNPTLANSWTTPLGTRYLQFIAREG